MKKILILVSLLIFWTGVGFCDAQEEDNLSVIGNVPSRSVDSVKEILSAKATSGEQAQETVVEETNTQATTDPTQGDRSLEEMKVYRGVMKDKKKDIELCRLDLEKEELLLKKKEAEKKIFEIDKTLPQEKREGKETVGSLQGLNTMDSEIFANEVKINLLLVSEKLKEAVITVRGQQYSVKEGDLVVNQLTVAKIDPLGCEFKQLSGTTFKVSL